MVYPDREEKMDADTRYGNPSSIIEETLVKKGVYFVLCGSRLLSKILIILLLLGNAGSIGTEAFEDMPVKRLDLQAKLLNAVMKFSTRRLGRMIVGIVYDQRTKNLAETFANELKKLIYNEQSIRVVFIHIKQLHSFDNSVNVLYVTPGNSLLLDTISRIAAQKDIFSCTGAPEYVRNGKIALGFDEYQGTSQIILNLTVAQSTNHNFRNPKFLNLQLTKKLILIK